MNELMILMVSCIFINNILLIQYLGNCPFLGVSKRMETAVGMAMAIVFVLVMSAAIAWITEMFLLRPFGYEHLRTLSYILVIAALVQVVEMFLKKSIPSLYAGLGIFLPLISVNCCVLGGCLINVREGYNFFMAVSASCFYAVGYGLALVLFAAARERILLARVPGPLQDTSIGLISAGMFSLAFFGLNGMI